MKIAFSMGSMLGGGAERVASVLANFFAQNGHTVTIYVSRKSGCVYALDPQVKIVDLTARNQGICTRIKCLRKQLKKDQNDIVISFLTHLNVEAIVASVGLKAPVIISERNNPYIEPKSKIYRALRKMVYPLAEGYVFQTNDAKAYFSKRIQARSRVIMNPISENLPKPYGGTREKRVVNVARLFPQKNQRLFIDAFCDFHKTHSDYTAEIYGDGPLEKELTQYIHEKKMDGIIKLCGFVENVLPAIEKAAMFVMSSDYEGMSNALIEAVGMGIPCISTDHPIGGARMTITDGENGFLVPVGDAHALCEKMEMLAEDETLAERISNAGTRLQEQLSIQTIGKQWLQYMEDVMGI